MAAEPPVDLSGVDGGDAGAAELGVTEFWRNIFPWDDLNAKSPPERWLRLGLDILPALAVLAAQGTDRPRLLQTDVANRLLTTSALNTVQRLTKAVAAGDSSLFIDNSVPFQAGLYVILVGAQGHPGVTTSGPFRILRQGTLGVDIVGQVPVPYSLGDYVVQLPTVTALGDGFKDRPVDSALSLIGAAGGAVTLSFPATPNQIWQLAYVAASIRQTGATAGVTTVQVWDGPSGTGTVLYSEQIAVDVTVGHADHMGRDRLPLKSTRGNALTVASTGPGATAVVALSAGAWQSVDRGVSE